MSDPVVGQTFAKFFVAAHQQVGDFRVVKVGNLVDKTGGNVASHFLTSEGHVVHSVTGPVSAQTLMQEADWAVRLYAEAMSRPVAQRREFVSMAHQQASRNARNLTDLKVHDLFRRRPLPLLQTVYEEIFEDILAQEVSEAGPRLDEAKKRIEFAKSRSLPILFILNDRDSWSPPIQSRDRTRSWSQQELMEIAARERAQSTPAVFSIPLVEQLMNQFVVIMMPLNDVPALSQITNQPPFDSHPHTIWTYVVAHSDCKQIASVPGGKEPMLAVIMANIWADTLLQNPPSYQGLQQAQAIIRKADPTAAERLKELAIELRAREKKNRSDRKGPSAKVAS